MQDATAIFHDRRKHERVDLHFSVHFHVLDESEALNQVDRLESKNRALAPRMHSAHTADISLGGMGMHGNLHLLDEPLQENSLLDLVIDLPGSPVHCVGTVAWFETPDADDFQAGVAFIELDREALGSVEKAIAEVLENSEA